MRMTYPNLNDSPKYRNKPASVGAGYDDVQLIPLVIASEARQSRVTGKQSGLLRRLAPRNDDSYLLHQILSRQFTEHIVQYPAIVEIFNLIGGVDAAQCCEGEAGAILTGYRNLNRLARLEVSDTLNRETVVSG